MDESVAGGVHHIALTVVDVERSKGFYCDLLGFREVSPLPTGVLVGKGQVLLGLRTAPERPLPQDRFDPNRVGLDHLSLTCGDREQLARAAALCAERGVDCGEIVELEPLGIAVLMLRDPDNIQIELAAPLR